MGGDSDMPYLYEPTHRTIAYPYSDFNPKAVTQASYQRLSQTTLPSQAEKAKQDGRPLINFNQHPDSYMIVSSYPRDANFQPLPPNTKRAVVALRWVQFALRLVQCIVAMGLLAGTICFSNTHGAETYLIRVPQAWDMLIALYAIYHLARPAKARTAPNQASYHIFALINDTGLIPLYLYVFLATRTNYELPLNKLDAIGDQVGDRWTSFFGNSNDTAILMISVYSAAAANAGLHLVNCAFDLALIILFRKIANLPPDMNPLEDNLTSRKPRTHKHKHKSSEMTESVLSEAEKRRMAQISGDTLNAEEARMSRTSFVNKSATTVDDRSIPFGHSRNQSSQTYSPHNPESARRSQHRFDGQQDLYRDAATNRRSRYEIRPDGKLEVRSRRQSMAPSAKGSMIQPALERDTMGHGVTVDFAATSPDPPRPNSPPLSAYLSSKRNAAASPVLPNVDGHSEALKTREDEQDLVNDNWYALEDDASDLGVTSRDRTLVPELKHLNAASKPVHEHYDSFEPVPLSVYPKPLGMNPPTPPMEENGDSQATASATDDSVHRSLTVASQGTISSSVYSESAPSLKSSMSPAPPKSTSTPKGRYYGDLNAAVRNIRTSSPAAEKLGHYGVPSPQPSRSPSPEKKTRVISRTGADIADESMGAPQSKFAVRSRRDVSGKIAEEGRGGTGARGFQTGGGARIKKGDWVD